jgi:ribokinase
MGRVFVAGSINMDVVATAERHPRVGETVAGREVLYFPGGKGANQAVAAAKLGAPTTLIGRLGHDAFGMELRAFLTSQGVDVRLVREAPGVHSGTAIITLANADNTIVVIPGANGLVSAEDIAAATLAKGDIAVSQFEIPLPAISAFFQAARKAGATTILNPAPAQRFGADMLALVDILVLNETELGLLAACEFSDDDEPARFVDAARSLRRHPSQIICVTLGRRGVLAICEGETLTVPGRTVKAVDTTGAGDCFCGTLAVLLAEGADLAQAAQLAVAAGTLSATAAGARGLLPTREMVAAIAPALTPRMVASQ